MLVVHSNPVEWWPIVIHASTLATLISVGAPSVGPPRLIPLEPPSWIPLESHPPGPHYKHITYSFALIHICTLETILNSPRFESQWTQQWELLIENVRVQRLPVGGLPGPPEANRFEWAKRPATERTVSSMKMRINGRVH